MQVKTTLWTVELLTFDIGAFELSLDIIGTSSVVFLPPRAVPLTLESVQILIIEIFNLKSFEEQVISLISYLVYLC